MIPINKDWRVIMKIGFILTLLPFCLKAEFLRLSWPTPNPAFAKGMGYSAFIQKTGPDKEFSSGVFGCVRNNGFKFHEGLDLYPVRRDAKGRAEDRVFAAMKGTVTYINTNSAYSCLWQIPCPGTLRPAAKPVFTVCSYGIFRTQPSFGIHG